MLKCATLRLSLALVALLAGHSARSAEPCDLVIRGARVVDGTGAPWYYADLAVRGGRIEAIGPRLAFEAKRTIEARGLVIAPGFIDMMGQTAAPCLKDVHAADNLLSQGITTINAGEGGSDAPLDGPAAHKAGWRTMAEYFERLDRAGLPLNAVQTVGHTQVRQIVIGEVDRAPSAAELDRMKTLVREAMEAGAIGLSSALIYPPAVYAKTDELVALARVAGQYGGGYYTHMRNEGDRLLEAIDEALAIGRQAETPVHIFHLKAAGKANWPKMAEAIARIQAARAAGQQVGADIYPYINNGLGIRSLIHPRHSAEGTEALLRQLDRPEARAEIRREMETEGGWENWYLHVGADWDRIVVAGIDKAPYDAHNGKSLAAIAQAVGKDPWDAFFEIAPTDAFAMPQSMSEANLILAMRQPFVSFDTDVGPAGGALIAKHPRGSGAFPRVLSRFVRDLGAIPLERALAQMSAVAANELRLYDRGRIAPGLAADLVLFDPKRVADRATFAEPALRAEGIRCVIVSGQVVYENGQATGIRPGRLLRGPGFRNGPAASERSARSAPR